MIPEVTLRGCEPLVLGGLQVETKRPLVKDTVRQAGWGIRQARRKVSWWTSEARKSCLTILLKLLTLTEGIILSRMPAITESWEVGAGKSLQKYCFLLQTTATQIATLALVIYCTVPGSQAS